MSASAAPRRRQRGVLASAGAQLRKRGVDPEHAVLALAGLALWRFVALLRRVGRLERDAKAVEARVHALEAVLHRTAEEVQKDGKAVEGAAWDIGAALKLPW
jgi:hypothetical protein